MGRRLILMRHAKSDWSHTGLSDRERPLNDRGNRDAPRMARWLESIHGVPDLVIASTATRVRETLAKMQSQWKKQPEIFFRDDLYLASPTSLLRALQADGADFESVMLIAHNPGLADLAQQLTGEIRHFPTAAMLSFKVSDDHPWHRLITAQDVQLEHWQIPRELPK